MAKDSQNCGECLPFLLFKAFEFCIPTKGINVPSGPEWLHEINYDGYRLRLERDRDRVRLTSRGGYDWTSRFPWIGEAALKNRVADVAHPCQSDRPARNQYERARKFYEL